MCARPFALAPCDAQQAPGQGASPGLPSPYPRGVPSSLPSSCLVVEVRWLPWPFPRGSHGSAACLLPIMCANLCLRVLGDPCHAANVTPRALGPCSPRGCRCCSLACAIGPEPGPSASGAAASWELDAPACAAEENALGGAERLGGAADGGSLDAFMRDSDGPPRGSQAPGVHGRLPLKRQGS